ncbi:RNA polymerase sigma factor [Demetria terragena]|uniref:RNA polymerase sigma factor n=1 Tax=Demetria terragena TaxID=63959 RepID=UPI00035C34E7|nr:sigma-70 family RNA polymerase sigma factor [Demetria terragena]
MSAAAQAVAAAHRAHWCTVLAATVGVTRDLSLAEDAVQDAYTQALTAWGQDGVPTNPGGWLATAARRRALDVVRREGNLRRKLPLLVWDSDPEEHRKASRQDQQIDDEAAPVVLDEQLRLIFLAAHPALAPTARVALTLRLVGGLTTAQIAEAFLVSESTMAARLTRAKKRIAISRMPCRVPGDADLGDRLDVVLDVISVLLAAGQKGPDPRSSPEAKAGPELIDVALRMLEALVDLLPGHTEPQGLLAQALVLSARGGTRRDHRGWPVPLAEQDRSAWNWTMIERADLLLRQALAQGGRGPYLIHGAISTTVAYPRSHDQVDWAEVVELYDLLLGHWPTPIVRLGQAVAIAECDGAQTALERIDDLAEALASHRQFHVIRGHLLRTLGEHQAASLAFQAALDLSGEDAQAGLLQELKRTSIAQTGWP